MFSRAGQKVQAGNLTAAHNILSGQILARLDMMTADQMQCLMAAPIPEEETYSLKEEVQRMCDQPVAKQLPKMSSLRRHLGFLNTGAEPSPSGMRNGCLMSVLRARNG